MITSSDAILIDFENSEIHQLAAQANDLALQIRDRQDLHERDHLERFIDVLMGEIAEAMVLKWLIGNGKQARSSIDKTSGKPDSGHDIIVVSNQTGEEVECSIKSSISFAKQLAEIPDEFRLATKKSELKKINIQVCFWLKLYTTPRVTVPSTKNAAMIGWFTNSDFQNGKFQQYATENREVPNILLKNARTMKSLLPLLR